MSLYSFFKNKKVLGIGTFNVCGTENEYFNDCDYQGLDLGPGEGVDIICPAQDYDAPDGTFDVIIKKARIGRNPKTKEVAEISQRKIIKFKPSLILKNKINRNEKK